VGRAHPDDAPLRDAGAQRQEGRRVAVHRRRRGDRSAGGANLVDVKTIGVIGTGQMGAGIAQGAAQAGLDVVMLDATVELAARAKAKRADTLAKLVARGKLEAAVREGTVERLHPAGDYAALAPCEFVVEAAPENEALKVKIFHEMERNTRAETILASN